MKIKYFAETDTLYIEFRAHAVAESREFDADAVIDLDAEGNLCAITVEHASRRTGIPAFSYEHVAA